MRGRTNRVIHHTRLEILMYTSAIPVFVGQLRPLQKDEKRRRRRRRTQVQLLECVSTKTTPSHSIPIEPPSSQADGHAASNQVLSRRDNQSRIRYLKHRTRRLFELSFDREARGRLFRGPLVSVAIAVCSWSAVVVVKKRTCAHIKLVELLEVSEPWR